MTDKELSAFALNEIASQVSDWLTWHKEHRAVEGLATEDGTHLVSIPARCWPSHGQLQNWVAALHRASQHLGE